MRFALCTETIKPISDLRRFCVCGQLPSNSAAKMDCSGVKTLVGLCVAGVRGSIKADCRFCRFVIEYMQAITRERQGAVEMFGLGRKTEPVISKLMILTQKVNRENLFAALITLKEIPIKPDYEKMNKVYQKAKEINEGGIWVIELKAPKNETYIQKIFSKMSISIVTDRQVIEQIEQEKERQEAEQERRQATEQAELKKQQEIAEQKQQQEEQDRQRHEEERQQREQERLLQEKEERQNIQEYIMSDAKCQLFIQNFIKYNSEALETGLMIDFDYVESFYYGIEIDDDLADPLLTELTEPVDMLTKALIENTDFNFDIAKTVMHKAIIITLLSEWLSDFRKEYKTFCDSADIDNKNECIKVFYNIHDFTPFLNIINEWYAKDTSKKIRAVMKSKGEAGEYLCTNPPYGYESEQVELEKLTAELRTELETFETDSVRADKFMELVKRYTDFSELTPAMLNEFVSKVIIHEADKSSGVRKQQVDIYLNYIGQFNVPEWFALEDDTPQVILTAKEKQRSQWREYARKGREKKRAAKMQEQNLSA